MYFIVPHSMTFLPCFLMAISVSFLVPLQLHSVYRYSERVGHIICSILNFYGEQSLEFYTFQELIYSYLRKYLRKSMSPIIKNVTVLLITTIATYVETRFVHYSRNQISKLSRQWRLVHLLSCQRIHCILALLFPDYYLLWDQQEQRPDWADIWKRTDHSSKPRMKQITNE